MTPVFNGSASLRNAAGQLVENVVKSVRRKETVDESYMDNLFDKVIALYHLDDVSENSSQGTLPTGSKVMLISIGAAWFIMGIVFVITLVVAAICRNLGMATSPAALFGAFWGFTISVIINYILSMKFVFVRKEDMDRRKEFVIFVIQDIFEST